MTEFVNDYSYDSRGDMTQVTQTESTGAAEQADFAYDADARLTAVDRSQGTGGNYVTVANSTYNYDDASRLTGLSYTDGSNSLAAYTWTYDNANRVAGYTYTSPTTAWDESVTYSYTNTSSTDINELTGVQSGGNTIESHAYDANGNRSVPTGTIGAANRVLFDGTYYYTYDAEGNRTAKFKSTDGQLDSTATEITTYTWDNRDRLTSVSYQAAFGGAYSYVVDYTYDALNRLVLADQTVGGGSTPLNETYLYDGQNLAMVLSGSGAVEAELYGPAVDQVLASENATTAPSPGC